MESFNKLATAKNAKYLISAVAAVYALSKLRKLTESNHSVFYLKRKKTKKPLDPAFFPQYMMNKDGLYIYIRKWVVKNPRAVVFISHGYGEHIGRYEHIATALNEYGYSVFGIDHQGNGQSEGDGGFVSSFSDYTSDFIEFVRFIQQKYLLNYQMPSFLLGHSMGGVIAIQVARESEKKENSIWPWSGIILSAPAIVPDPKTATPFMITLANTLSRFLPKLRPTFLDSKAVSRIESVIDSYEYDPLVFHGGISINFGAEYLKTVNDIKKNIKNIHFPFIILQGSADRLCVPSGAEYFFQETSSEDKTIKRYEGAYHELFNDLCQKEVFSDVFRWMDSRTLPPL